MESPSTSPSGIASRATYSCIRCADRKVKCDRKTPCGACVRHSVTCVYNTNPPPRNRHKRAKDQALISRLKQYEALLREKGVNLSELADGPEPEPHREPRSDVQTSIGDAVASRTTPPSMRTGSARSINKAQVIGRQGQSKFVENILWTGIVEEFHEPGDALGASSDDVSDAETRESGFDLVFGETPKASMEPSHPSPAHINRLWETFVENFDPLIKVIHVPTIQPAIEKAASILQSIPRSFEALMFAIYGAAVMSMDNEECVHRQGAPRKALLKRYTDATKMALSNVGFMSTTNLVVLQALVLHLLAVRDIMEPRAVWSLTGVAMRIAQSMGLDRDGTHLRLPPFETEMRRRVWWALKLHDFRTAELCGIDKFRDLDVSAGATKPPSNVNDDQLYPGMPALSHKPSSSTDAMFVSVKCELQLFGARRIASLRRQGDPSLQCELRTPGLSPAEADESSKEIEELLETKYLRYCDPSQPLHLMTMIMARCALKFIYFLSHHPRRWTTLEQTPASERQLVWDVCLKLLEQHNFLRSNPLLKQFAWHGPYFQQWHAIIHVLDTLRMYPSTIGAEKAWKLIGDTYSYTPEIGADIRKPIHIAVGNLCLKAYDRREAVLHERDVPAAPEPLFIQQLRLQQEKFKAKRQAKGETTGNFLAKGSGVTGLGTKSDRISIANPSARNQEHKAGPMSERQEAVSIFPRHSNHNLPVVPEFDTFWFSQGFVENQVRADDSSALVDLDFDSSMHGQYDPINDLSNAIDWNEWDAWLADSNLIGPLPSEDSAM